jgi:hypothetical protein
MDPHDFERHASAVVAEAAKTAGISMSVRPATIAIVTNAVTTDLARDAEVTASIAAGLEEERPSGRATRKL